MKKCRTLLALLLMLAVLSVPAMAIELEAGTGDAFYVQDNANVLSSETESLIAYYNATLEEQCDGAQLVVVTVSYLDEDTQIASLQLMNDWGVGDETESNGMLLLLVAEEYRGWLSTGDGLDEVFTDDMVDEYLDDYFWDYIDADEYDEGVQTLAGMLYAWYLDYYSVESGGDSAAYYADDYDMGYHDDEVWEEPYQQSNGGFSMIITIIVLLVIIWLLVSVNRFNRMRGWGYTGGFWPIFWFRGPGLYRDWYRRRGPGGRGPGGPGGPGGRGPGGPGGGGFGGGPGGGAPRGGSGPRGGGGGFGGGPGGGGFGGGGHGGGGGGGRH